MVFSYEESYGYMLGGLVRDKDAVNRSLLLTEMAAYYAAKGMTVLDPSRPSTRSTASTVRRPQPGDARPGRPGGHGQGS